MNFYLINPDAEHRGILLIKSFMNKQEECAARRKSLENHIRLLEERYSGPERREAVALLEDRLAKVPALKS